MDATAVIKSGIDFVCLFYFFWLFYSFAYIEFADKESVQLAVGLDESLFRGRQIKVCFNQTSFILAGGSAMLSHAVSRRTLWVYHISDPA